MVRTTFLRMKGFFCRGGGPGGVSTPPPPIFFAEIVYFKQILSKSLPLSFPLFPPPSHSLPSLSHVSFSINGVFFVDLGNIINLSSCFISIVRLSIWFRLRKRYVRMECVNVYSWERVNLTSCLVENVGSMSNVSIFIGLLYEIGVVSCLFINSSYVICPSTPKKDNIFLVKHIQNFASKWKPNSYHLWL